MEISTTASRAAKRNGKRADNSAQRANETSLENNHGHKAAQDEEQGNVGAVGSKVVNGNSAAQMHGVVTRVIETEKEYLFVKTGTGSETKAT